MLKKIKDYIDALIISKSSKMGLIIITSIDTLMKEISEPLILEELTKSLKAYEKIGVVLVEENNKYKKNSAQQWVRNVISPGNGVWIGDGISNQSSIMCNTNRAMQLKIEEDMGYIIIDSEAKLAKMIDFYSKENE